MRAWRGVALGGQTLGEGLRSFETESKGVELYGKEAQVSMQCVRGRREEMGLEHAEIILHSTTDTACTGIYTSSTLVDTIIIRRPHMTYVRIIGTCLHLVHLPICN